MKKGLFVLAGLAFMGMGVTSQVQAKQNVCVFDLLGKAGETFKITEEWAVAAKEWKADIRLISYQDEAKAQNDFEAGKNVMRFI